MGQTMTRQEPKLVSVDEAARMFGFKPRQVRHWLDTGKIRRYEQELTGRVFVNADEIAEKLRIKPQNGDT